MSSCFRPKPYFGAHQAALPSKWRHRRRQRPRWRSRKQTSHTDGSDRMFVWARAEQRVDDGAAAGKCFSYSSRILWCTCTLESYTYTDRSSFAIIRPYRRGLDIEFELLCRVPTGGACTHVHEHVGESLLPGTCECRMRLRSMQ